MKIIFLKLFFILLSTVAIFSFFPSAILAATMTVPVLGIPRYGWQTINTSLEVCDGSTSSTFLSYMYSDFYYLRQMDFPPIGEVISLDYCIRGRGNISVGTYTDHRQEFTGNGLEQCFNSTVSPYYTSLILANSSDAVFGGAANSSSSVDCLYVKINYIKSQPTPTITPTPTSQPTPTIIPSPTPSLVPTLTPTVSLSPTEEPTLTPTIMGQACLPTTKELLLIPTLVPTVTVTIAPTPTTVVCAPTLPPVVCPDINPNTSNEISTGEVLGEAIEPSSEPSPTTVIKAGLIKKTQPTSKNNFLKYIFPVVLLILLVLLILFFNKKRRQNSS